jgi:hypothetical protein
LKGRVNTFYSNATVVAHAGATPLTGGTLQVDSTITGTPSLTVNPGGLLNGGGTIDPLTVTINNADTFMPGAAGTLCSSTTSSAISRYDRARLIWFSLAPPLRRSPALPAPQW